MLKKVTSVIIAIGIFLSSAVSVRAENTAYSIGFNNADDIELVSTEQINLNSYEIDEGQGCLVIRPRLVPNAAYDIKVDGEKLAANEYAKIRFYFGGAFSKESEMAVRIDNNNYTVCSLADKEPGKWYEAVFKIKKGLNADKIKLYPVYSTRGNWSVAGNIYIDYISFFGTESEAKVFREGDDNDLPIDTAGYTKDGTAGNGGSIISNTGTYISGYSQRTFMPDAQIIRSEAATIISRIIDGKTAAEEGFELPFKDVPEDAWYYSNLVKLLNNGIIDSAESFRPDDAITRIEFVEMLYRAGAFEDAKATAEFSDVPVSSPAYQIVSKAGASGVIAGYSDGSFRPDGKLTRAETVAIVNRVLKVDTSADPSTVTKVYDDVPITHWAYVDIMLVSGGKTTGEGTADPDDKSSWLNGVYDVNNTRGYEWIPVPLVSKEQKDNGYIGGEGGQILTYLDIDSSGQVLVCGADVGTMGKSIDGGKTWYEFGRFPTNSAVNGLSVIRIDPNNPDRMVGGDMDGSTVGLTRQEVEPRGIYLTEDGEHFELVLPFHFQIQLRDRSYLAYDPTSYDEKINGSSVVYFSSPDETYTDDNKTLADMYVEKGYNDGCGLYRSDDGGKTWKRVNETMSMAALWVSYDDGTVYAIKNDILYVSKDKGESFTQVRKNVPVIDVIASRPTELYAFTTDGVLISRDHGTTFEVSGKSGYDSEGADSFKVSPANPKNMVYSKVGINNRKTFQYSNDGGNTWQDAVYDTKNEFIRFNQMFRIFQWSPTDENKLWLTDNFVLSSEDAGATYHWDNNGLTNGCVNSWFKQNIYNPDLWPYPLQDYSGGFTLDGGNTFENIQKLSNGAITTHAYGAYVVDEQTIMWCKSSVWEGKPSELYMSWDGGKTWEKKLDLPDGYLNNRCIQSGTNKDVLFCGRWRSTDKGKTWTEMPDILYVSAVKAGNPIIIGESVDRHTVYKSVDDGETWSKMFTVEKDESKDYHGIQYCLDYDYENDIVYFAHYGYLHKYENGKITSFEESMREVAPDRWMFSLAVDPIDPNVIYCGMMGSRAKQYDYFYNQHVVLRSCDAGKTWQRIDTTFDNEIIPTGPVVAKNDPKNLFVDPRDGYVYLCCANSGIYKFPPPYELK